MKNCSIEGYLVCRVNLYKLIVDDINKYHIYYRKKFSECDVRGIIIFQQNLWPFLNENEDNVMASIPAEVKPQLPKLEIKVKEKILKAEVVEEHIEKTQHLQICEQHDNKASTLVLETTKEVGVLTSCEEVNEDAEKFVIRDLN
ncbi:hypothetical protein Tco_1294709 [Tanacetum coccineum]